MTTLAEKVFRVAFGWSNYRDFPTLEEAQAFIGGWKRPSDWLDVRLWDAHLVSAVDTGEARTEAPAQTADAPSGKDKPWST